MEITRRALLTGAMGAAMAAASRDARAADAAWMPVGYVSHGSPFLAIDKVRGAALRAWGETLPKPRGIVVMTPHYASRRFAVGSTARGFAVYSMPDWLKRQLPQDLEYASPPSESLALRVEALLGGASAVERSARRGFDHTSWMPLMHLFPAADVPVLELAYPYVPEGELFALGRRLAPLRDEGVFFLASGGMTHNLAALTLDAPEQKAPVPRWAAEFDQWSAERLLARDVDALVDFRHKAPAADLAHPDDGAHYRVLLVALGIALGGGSSAFRVRFPITGFESSLSNRCVEIA